MSQIVAGACREPFNLSYREVRNQGWLEERNSPLAQNELKNKQRVKKINQTHCTFELYHDFNKLLYFKESKVTQMLKECLGSFTCQATMLAHVTPEPSHYSETLHTTQLASRIHRMRRKKAAKTGSNSNGSGGSGSSDDLKMNR